ncbi:MAG: hypothetical protein AB7V62_14760 [Thermoleophilia bacterium]
MTDTDEAQARLWRRIRLRAEWLQDLAPAERETLADVALREVERRFDAWLDARPPVGEHGGG